MSVAYAKYQSAAFAHCNIHFEFHKNSIKRLIRQRTKVCGKIARFLNELVSSLVTRAIDLGRMITKEALTSSRIITIHMRRFDENVVEKAG